MNFRELGCQMASSLPFLVPSIYADIHLYGILPPAIEMNFTLSFHTNFQVCMPRTLERKHVLAAANMQIRTEFLTHPYTKRIMFCPERILSPIRPFFRGF